MAPVDEEDAERAARVHWEELGEANEETPAEACRLASALIRVPGKSDSEMISIPLVFGMQGNVRVWMALMRLPAPHDTDVVMSWNETRPGPEEASKERFQKLIASVEWHDIDFMISE